MGTELTSENAKEKSTDLRVKRTQLMLQNAFMDLVVEVGFGAITIQMLAERAMINRATFYRHYEDIFDLAEKIYLRLAQEYRESVEAFMPGSPVETLQRLFEHCGQYRAYYLALLTQMPRSQDFVRAMIEEQAELFFRDIGLEESEMTMPLPVVLRFWSTAQLELVRWWLETEEQVSAAEMAHYLWRLLDEGAVKQLGLPPLK